MKNNKLFTLFATGMIAMSMFGCQKVEDPEVSKPVEQEKTNKYKTMGDEDSLNKMKVINKTEMGIDAFKVKSYESEDFTENLLEKKDVFKNKETRVLYYGPTIPADLAYDIENFDIEIKISFENDDDFYTIKLNPEKMKKDKEKMPTITIIKAEDSDDIQVNYNDESNCSQFVSASKDKSESSDKETTEDEESKKDSDKEESSSSDKKEESSSKSSSKPSSGDNKNSSTAKPSSGGSSSNTKPGNSGNSSTSKPSPHTHNWVKKVIHHDAVTHTEQVLVSEAWDEPIYETKYADVCNTCGADITSDPVGHLFATEHDSYRCDVPIKVLKGYNHHDAVYETKTIVDKAAYDEVIYTCSCGATK